MPVAYKIRLRRVGDSYVARLRVRVARDAFINVTAKVSARAIANLMSRDLRGKVGDVGFSFSKILKRVLPAARVMAKAKALQKARRLLLTPSFRRASRSIPGLRLGGKSLAAINVSLLSAKAKTLKRKGRIARAKAMMRRARKLAARSRLSRSAYRRAARAGFKMSLDPRMVRAVRTVRKSPDGPALSRAIRVLPASIRRLSQ